MYRYRTVGEKLEMRAESNLMALHVVLFVNGFGGRSFKAMCSMCRYCLVKGRSNTYFVIATTFYDKFSQILGEPLSLLSHFQGICFVPRNMTLLSHDNALNMIRSLNIFYSTLYIYIYICVMQCPCISKYRS